MLGIDGEPPPTLLSADTGGRVIHLTSLTKTVAPGLRCGAMVLPPDLVAPLAEAARSTYIAPGAFAQATAMAYIDSGALEPVVEVTRTLLRERRDAALQCLAGAAEISWSAPAGGYFLWLELGGDGARELCGRAARAGVQVVAGNDFFLDGSSDRHVRVAFCAAPVDDLREGVTRLVRLLGRAGETEPQPLAGG
jgi:2-aminoadipate transaminase